MSLAVFSAHQYDRTYFELAKTRMGYEGKICYHEVALGKDTVTVAEKVTAVCVFVNDVVDAEVLQQLHDQGVQAILLRCAGYNNVDLHTAEELGFFVANVPSYSPESVAEYAVGLVQCINRKICRAYDRVRLGNFTLEGLVGMALHGKTIGIIGTGRIGVCFARIMSGFGCQLLAYDPYPNEEFSKYGQFVELENLLQRSDIVSLHCPLLQSTKHIINKDTLSQMKVGAILVNVSRGGLVDSEAVIESLKQNHLRALAIDVYEREDAVFFSDHSDDIIQDDTLMRLITFPNVIVTGHQAFFTEDALTEIATVTLENLTCFSQDLDCRNSLLKGNWKERKSVKTVRM
jgi:D-lactate dehydrogenase